MAIDDITSELDTLIVSKSCICQPEQCSMMISNTNNDLNILHMNIRSVNKNFDELIVFLKVINIQCDVIILSECWLSSVSTTPYLEGFTSFQSSNPFNQNDGVIIYVIDGLTCSVTEPHFEEASGLLCTIGNLVAILAIYRSPSFKSIDKFINDLDAILLGLSRFKSVALMGDINIDIKQHNTDRFSNIYLNLTSSHGLLPAHLLPTRLDNCLDHVLLKSNQVGTTLIIENSVTDHSAIILSIKSKVKNTANHTKRILNYSNVAKAIAETDFSDIMSITDVNEATDKFIYMISSIIRTNTSTVKIPRKNRNLKPWITPGLMRCIKNRDRMNQKLKKSRDNITLQTTYKRYRNFCNDLLRKLKIAYEKNEFLKSKNNPKATWKVIKKITHLNQTKNKCTDLLNISNNPQESVELVNSFFAEIGKKLAEKISPRQSQNIDNTFLEGSQNNSFVLQEVDEAEVENIIRTLRKDSSVGWDTIPTKIIQTSSMVLLPVITYVCNLSLATGVFPTAFKKALIHPIYKSGDRDSVNNYRPISVLTGMSKILERIINNKLVKYLDTYGIISQNQFGFRSGKSSEDAVTSLSDLITRKLDQGMKCLGLFLDLSKAFDTVSVPRLLLKLERIGVRGTQLNLFESYLSGRSQCVKINDHISSEFPLSNFGVPQGSILGPTLFLIYVNQLCSPTFRNCDVFSYADDTALIVYGSDWDEVKRYAEESLISVSNWLSSNLLTLNFDKTKFVPFSINSKGQPHKEYSLQSHTCDPRSDCQCPCISRASHIKYLGVVIDENLNWSKHITSLTIKIRKIIYIFKLLRSSADIETLKTVYFALCQSLLMYCVPAWGGATKTSLLPLERAQRAVLKVMLSKPFRYPTEQLYQDCKLLTVRQLFVYRSTLRKHSSITFSDMSQIQRRPARICQIECHRTTFAGHQYYILSSRLYNKLQNQLNINKLNRYKLKRTLLNWLQTLNYHATEELISPINI